VKTGEKIMRIIKGKRRESALKSTEYLTLRLLFLYGRFPLNNRPIILKVFSKPRAMIAGLHYTS